MIWYKRGRVRIGLFEFESTFMFSLSTIALAPKRSSRHHCKIHNYSGSELFVRLGIYRGLALPDRLPIFPSDITPTRQPIL